MNETVNRAIRPDFKKSVYWTCTFTGVHEGVAGLNPLETELIRDFLKLQEYAVAHMEYGESNENPHIHAVFTHRLKKQDHLKRVILKDCYGYSQRDEVPSRLIKLEKAKSWSGAVGYLSKEVAPTETHWLLRGFERTWIQEAYEEWSERRRERTLIEWKYSTCAQAPAHIMEYAEVHHLSLVKYEDFKYVLRRMLEDDWRIITWRRELGFIWSYIALKGVADPEAFDRWCDSNMKDINPYTVKEESSLT